MFVVCVGGGVSSRIGVATGSNVASQPAVVMEVSGCDGGDASSLNDACTNVEKFELNSKMPTLFSLHDLSVDKLDLDFPIIVLIVLVAVVAFTFQFRGCTA